MHTSWITWSLLPCCMVALEACSGAESHRAVADDAGSGGAGNPTGGSGGRATGGTASGGQSGGGVGGSGGAAGGAGGALPEGGLAGGVFFSVEYGAKGLPGTGVASARSSAAAIFASNGSGPSHVAGTNVVGVTAAQLGLLDTDDLNDIAVLKPAPAHPLYHFSIAKDADGAGFAHTDVDRSSRAGELPGDVFVSDGIGQHYDGETGHRPGFNALTIDEAALGLSTVPGSDAGAGSSDDLDALELGVTGVPSKIYFTVSKGAMGAAGSPLSATPGPERGCTVFESTLNGTHKKTYSCADLGLSAGDEVDALAVHGASTPQQILFSVKIGAVGGAGTAVATEAANAEAGGDIFRSTGAGTNELLVDEAGLGLNTTDELDALAVTEKELTPRFAYEVGSCGALTPDPRNDVTGSLAYNANWHAWLSTGIFVIGRAPLSTSGSVELLAYDVSTCTQVGSTLALDLAADGGLSLAKPLAIIPLAGWSKAAPFANVEIWGVTESAGTSLVRFAATGGPPVQIVRLSPTVVSTIDMVYRTASDDFAILFAGSSGKQIAFEKRPAANAVTAASPSIYPVPFPCEEYTGFMGYDPASNGIEIAHNNTGGKRICSLDSALWFREPPRPWLEGPTPDGGGVPPFRTAYEGFIVPGAGMFGIQTLSSFDLVTLRPVP